MILQGLDQVGQAVSVFDENLNLALFNKQFSELHGYPPSLIEIGTPFENFVRFNAERGRYGDGDVELIIEARMEQARKSEPFTFLRATGNGTVLEVRRAPLSEGGFVTTYIDVTDRTRAEEDLKRSLIDQQIIASIMEISLKPISLFEMLQQTLALVLSSHGLGLQYQGSIFLVDEETNELVMVAQQGLHEHLLTECARIGFGYCLCGRAAETRDVVFANCLDHRHGVMFEGIKQHGHYCVPIQTEEVLLGVLNLYVPHGHKQTEEENRFVSVVAGATAGMIRHKEAEEKVRHAASHDGLTNLPNRTLFLDRVSVALATARRNRSQAAVLFIDLDGFKAVNDTLGHEAGDLLLQGVAERLRSCVREMDTVSRHGGDEFTISLVGVTDRDAAALVAKKLISRLSDPFALDGRQANIGASIGIAMYPEHGETAEDLLQQADAAMYAVKHRGKNNFEFASLE